MNAPSVLTKAGCVSSSVNLGILSFLAFEQVFKNALTPCPWAAGKGGSDFNPKANPTTRSCASATVHGRTLPAHRPDTDVPAGDIGVGDARDRFLFGMYKKLRNEFTGVFTGKDELGRQPDPARGHRLRLGLLRGGDAGNRNQTLEGKVCLVSGSGNVAQYTVEKLIQLGANRSRCRIPRLHLR